MTCCSSPNNAPELDPDYEGPSQTDLDRFDFETTHCPGCHEEVYDQATVCQHCGTTITDAPLAKNKLKATIFTIGLILAGVAFVLTLGL